MSTQSNTSVHLKSIYRKKNLCGGSVVTLFLLCLFVVLSEFFFPRKNHHTFVTVSALNPTEQIFLSKELLSSSMSLAMIIQTFQIIVAHTMLGAKAASRLSFNSYYWFLYKIVNFSRGGLSSSDYFHHHSI